MTFKEMENRIKDICSKQYSYIIAEYSNFHINDFSKICFDLTYLSKTLMNNGIKYDTLITIKTNLKANKIMNHIFHILISKENIFTFLSFIISSIMLIINVLFSTKLKTYISSIYLKYFKITVREALKYRRVREYLFYNDESPLKSVGLQNIEERTKELLKTDKYLNDLVIDCKKYFFELKLSIASNLIFIIILIVEIITAYQLIQNLKNEVGIFKTLITLISYKIILFVLCLFYKMKTHLLESFNIKPLKNSNQ